MPELPDITIYVEALQKRLPGETLKRAHIHNPFLLRSFEPPLETSFGKRVEEVRRLGKRIAIGLENEIWLVMHLMIAGRLHWRRSARFEKQALATFEFTSGTLSLTEAGTKRRASLHVVFGEMALAAHNPGGLEVLEASLPQFAAALTRRNHTLKRALTDPQLFSGIGNAYSDEILHHARLSPVALTQRLSAEQIEQLFIAVQSTLRDWTQRLRDEAGDRFPEQVTAFRPGMAVHGRFGLPCPDCGSAVQRIRYAENETDYCGRCQTGGKLLADRSLSRLLKDDWPRCIDELEKRGDAGSC